MFNRSSNSFVVLSVRFKKYTGIYMDTLTPSFVEETNHMRSSEEEEEEEKEDGDEEHQEEAKGRMNYARVSLLSPTNEI